MVPTEVFVATCLFFLLCLGAITNRLWHYIERIENLEKDLSNARSTLSGHLSRSWDRQTRQATEKKALLDYLNTEEVTIPEQPASVVYRKKSKRS